MSSLVAILGTDEHLRLVIDELDEDDALCVALCCKATRDAALARFPAGIRTRTQAACKSTAHAAWAMGLGEGHAPAGARVWAAAARLNRVHIMRVLVKLGIDADGGALREAALHGSLFSVEWLLLHHELIPGPREVEAAAAGGQPRILERFLALSGVRWDSDAYVAAARSGCTVCLRLLMEHETDEQLDVYNYTDPSVPRELAAEAAPPAGLGRIETPTLAQRNQPIPAPDSPARLASTVSSRPAPPQTQPTGLLQWWLRFVLGPAASSPERERRSAPATVSPPPPGPGPRSQSSPPATQPAQEDTPWYEQQGRSPTAPPPPVVRRRWDERACEAAAAARQLEALEVLLVHGAPCTTRAIQCAAAPHAAVPIADGLTSSYHHQTDETSPPGSEVR